MSQAIKPPYHGEPMYQCNILPFDFTITKIIIVSGASWNPCGHMIINTAHGWYFHVVEVRGRPYYMREEGYQRFLKENGKHEISRKQIVVPKPIQAHIKLEELLSKPWNWYVLPHNCANFVETVLQAGGANVGIYTNCPTLEEMT